MVVPRLTHHLQRHGKTDDACQRHSAIGNGSRRFALAAVLRFLHKEVAEHYADCRHSHAYPQGKGVERTGKRIVALTRLARCLVEIKHNGDTGHEEEEEHNPELLYAAHRIGAMVVQRLIEQADEAQKQGKHVENIVPLVALAEFVGQRRLVAQTRIVDKRYARNPVAQMRLTVALDIVLAAGEIPHEISPVHMIELIIDKITQVDIEARLPHRLLEHRRIGCAVDSRCHRLHISQIRQQFIFRSKALLSPLTALLGRNIVYVGSRVAGPRLVAAHMLSRGVIAVYASEKHVEVRHSGVLRTLNLAYVFVGFVGRNLHLFGVYFRRIVECRTVLVAQISVENACTRTPILVDKHIVIARAGRILFFLESLGKYGPVEQRTVAILLTVEIRRKSEHIIRCVLIHGRIGRCTNQKQCIRRIADEYDKHADYNQ